MHRRQFIKGNIYLGISSLLLFQGSSRRASGFDCVTESSCPHEFQIGNQTSTLYAAALFVVLDRQLASIALVQRHLRLGYSAAVTAFDALSESGAISRNCEIDGYRRILMDDASQENFLAQFR